MSEPSEAPKKVDPAQPLTVTWTAAVATWVLSGPPGLLLDTFVSVAAGQGLGVEPIKAPERYRLWGRHGTLQGLADTVGSIEGYALAPETAPPGAAVSARIEPVRAPRRTTYVQGTDATGLVARAVDCGLRVASAGAARWAVTGSSALQMQWLAAYQRRPLADVMTAFGTDAEAIAAEDSHGIEVRLADREITTELIERDERDNLTRVVQTERTLERK